MQPTQTRQSRQPAAPLPEQAQAAQEHLGALAGAAVLAAWHLLDPHAIQKTVPALALAVHASVTQLGRASAAGMGDYYRRARAAAGVTGSPVRVPLSTGPTQAEVESELVQALAGLFGPVTDATVTAAQTNVQGTAERLVLQQGRLTILSAVSADRQARGWARIAEPGACAFCAMLAIRGPVYRSEATADFVTHDNCRCIAEPVFGNWRASASTQELKQTYDEATVGLSGNAARIAFRQALEGRTRTPNSLPATASAVTSADPVVTIAALERSVAVMRRNNTDGSLSKAIAVTQDRINALRSQSHAA